MLDRAGDDMVSFLPISKGNSFESQVVCFRTATGEDYSSRTDVDKLGYMTSRVFDSFMGFAPLPMNAGRIAKGLF